MGWFWAENAAPRRPVAPHAMPPIDGTPPPGCPMHAPSSASPFPPQSSTQPPKDTSSCPVACPSSAKSPTPSTLSKLNPLNYMPTLSQDRSSHQKYSLPTDRTTSSIPRGDTNANWEYPSPQQMYNAMLRKGYDDTPEDAVESMVEVHNFLNEGAWNEIEAWEARFSRGLSEGWQVCRWGEVAWEEMVAQGDLRGREVSAPKLLRFMGRPGDMTPKAQMWGWAGRLYPEKFGNEPPFDRHDWFVQRTTPLGEKREVRYVIDYYSAPPEPTGEPVFYLDVRPAIDTPTAACERMIRWGGDVWFRATGSGVRESIKAEKAKEKAMS